MESMDPVETPASILMPDLRFSTSPFFDYDFTYLALAHHVLLYIGTNGITWNLFGGGESKIRGNDRTHGISHKSLIIHSLAFTARMIEFILPMNDFTYDFGVASGFSSLYWLATLCWMVFRQGKTASLGESRVGLNATLFVTAGLAYSVNFINDMEFTPALFCWAWSHYLEGVAMIPQLWTMISLHKKGAKISTSIWVAVHMTALARVFQLLNWIYLLYDANILDVLQVAVASFYLFSYVIFLIIIIYLTLTKEGNQGFKTVTVDTIVYDEKKKKKNK